MSFHCIVDLNNDCPVCVVCWSCSLQYESFQRFTLPGLYRVVEVSPQWRCCLPLPLHVAALLAGKKSSHLAAVPLRPPPPSRRASVCLTPSSTSSRQAPTPKCTSRTASTQSGTHMTCPPSCPPILYHPCTRGEAPSRAEPLAARLDDRLNPLLPVLATHLFINRLSHVRPQLLPLPAQPSRPAPINYLLYVID